MKRLVHFSRNIKVVGLLNFWAQALRRHCWISSFQTPRGETAVIIVGNPFVGPLLNKLLSGERIFWKPIITTQRYLDNVQKQHMTLGPKLSFRNKMAVAQRTKVVQTNP